MVPEILTPAPVAATLRERRQQRTRADLVDAALEVIADVGVHEATIERVSAASGISRGTVYAHFAGGRDALLAAAYAELGRRQVERTLQAVSEAESWSGRLLAHARVLFDLARDEHTGDFYHVSGPTLVKHGPERGIGSGASVLLIADTLAIARGLGEVDAALDAQMTAVLLVGALREAAITVAAGETTADQAFAAFAGLVNGLANSR
ncbi:TetR/AcrR family transcriptional regulator [Leucobacter musarum]|uniref:TetR/AcrR family transcriptional regulator n=1 Tax=Leucobacter musarum TaxID=1930747 RepID=UPI000A7A1A07|nr:TetR/AcrR family transcriptional regulator [Leucobacter musarum]